MSLSIDVIKGTAQQCTYAQLTGVHNGQELCHVQELYENVHVCYGCERYSTAIPEDCAGVLEESYRARMLVANFISGEIDSPNYRPLSLVKYANRKETAHNYAVMVGGDPDDYECMHLEFSSNLSMTVRPIDLKDAVNAVPLGLPFDRNLVEALIGTLSDDTVHTVEKMLANGWSFIRASAGVPNQDYSRLLFRRGYERIYVHPDGKVVTVPKGLTGKIELDT
ncbi:MAG: hypothetical protein K2X29_12395 [Candidatus Obscuribacterales bacterium]|nr:hypothetical protein [Candidatus Obscuribacterales bacterium]